MLYLTKVFGIGLSKTGTNSLNSALNSLGYKSKHYPCDDTTFQELSIGNYNLSIMKDHDAGTDVTFAPFYKELDVVYPNSKFILTVRNLDDWLYSMRVKWVKKESGTTKFADFINHKIFGTLTFTPVRFADVFELHNKQVMEYFGDRLLVMDICAGDGWTKLCSFLDKPVPNEPFPHKNRTKTISYL